MDRQILQAILDHLPQAKRSGDTPTYRLPDSADASILADAGDTLLTIERVTRIELHDTWASFATARGEVYALPYARLAGVRTGGEGSASSPRKGAGFFPTS